MRKSSGKLLFGTAGVPESSNGTSTLSGVREVARLGLDCLEIEFVQGVKMGSETGRKVRAEAERLGVRLSVHAPYYVNLLSPEGGKRMVSQERLLSSARMAEVCGAESVVFHCGYYGKRPPDEAFAVVKDNVKEVASILKAERCPAVLRPEVMGKKSQFGSLEEILFLCREVEGIQPCLDFSHIYAREGKANSYEAFTRTLRKVEKKLGAEAMKRMHIHISGVVFSAKGEIKHLNLKESDFRYDEWVQALKDYGVEGLVVCESPIQDADALMLKHLYKEVRFS